MSAVMLAAGAGQAAFRIYDSGFFSAMPYQGAYVPNSGIKTAAQWIRAQKGSTGYVFSDASGGAGLEPPIMSIYLQRPYFAVYDARRATVPYERFKHHTAEIDFLLVVPAHRHLAAKYFGDAFKEALVVTDGKAQRLLVYARKERVTSRAVMDVSTGDALFDRRYSLGCPN